jgi:F0F1-type ATP synthase membrane subunit b/b'
MLELDLATVVFQIINFGILAGLLYWLLFKPITRTIRKRAAEKEGIVRELERERQAVSVNRAELDERLSRLEEESANTIALAREQSERERAELLAEAQTEIEQILVEAQADAYRIRQQAINTFHTDLVDAILDVSGVIIGNTLPEEVHGSLVRQLSNRIWEMGRSDIQRVETFRQSLGQREPTAYITSAESLTLDQQGLMARTLTALADRHIDLEVQVNPKLVAGLRVRIGDIVVDSSVAGQLDELRDQVVGVLEERMQDDGQSIST